MGSDWAPRSPFFDYGSRRQRLRQTQQLAAAQAARVEATQNRVRLETTQGLPSLQIRIRRDEIARYGINVADVNDVVEAAVGGKEARVLTLFVLPTLYAWFERSPVRTEAK